MCTTGVLRLGDDDYILFKNKDFGRAHFDDRIVIERDVFGVQGITTWAGSDPDADVFSGFSVGAGSSGLFVCDSNVRTLPDHANYDDLVEIALRQGHDVPSAIAAVEGAVGRQPYLWGNLIMIDRNAAAAIEVRGNATEVVVVTPPAARSNHHLVFGATPDDDDVVTTAPRLLAAQRRVDDAVALEDVFELLRSHDDGATGICNHALHNTVYSYVLRRRGSTTTLYVSQGRPCTNPKRVELDVPLGDRWSSEAAARFSASYPSARAAAIR